MRTLGMSMVALFLPMLLAGTTAAISVYLAFAHEPMPVDGVAIVAIEASTEASGAPSSTFFIGAPAYRRGSAGDTALNGWLWNGEVREHLWLLSSVGVWPRDEAELASDSPGHGRLTVKETHQSLAGLTVEVSRAP